METCHFFQVPPAQRQQLTGMAAEPCGCSAWWLGTKHSHVPMCCRFIPVWLELWQSLLLHVWSIFRCESQAHLWHLTPMPSAGTVCTPMLFWRLCVRGSYQGLSFSLSGVQDVKPLLGETETSLLVVNRIFSPELFATGSASSVCFSQQ